jgi:hypothetical protein
MKVRVTKDFVDQYTKEYIKKGMVLRNLTEERARELITKGVAEKMEERLK